MLPVARKERSEDRLAELVEAQSTMSPTPDQREEQRAHQTRQELEGEVADPGREDDGRAVEVAQDVARREADHHDRHEQEEQPAFDVKPRREPAHHVRARADSYLHTAFRFWHFGPNVPSFRTRFSFLGSGGPLPLTPARPGRGGGAASPGCARRRCSERSPSTTASPGSGCGSGPRRGTEPPRGARRW